MYDKELVIVDLKVRLDEERTGGADREQGI